MRGIAGTDSSDPSPVLLSRFNQEPLSHLTIRYHGNNPITGKSIQLRCPIPIVSWKVLRLVERKSLDNID